MSSDCIFCMQTPRRNLDKPLRQAYNSRMTTEAKVHINTVAASPLPCRYLYSRGKHAVRFTADGAVFKIETDGKTAKIVKSGEIGYELVLSEYSSLTLKTPTGEFYEPEIALHSLSFSETPDGFTLAAEYSLPPHNERKSLRVTCEK